MSTAQFFGAIAFFGIKDFSSESVIQAVNDASVLRGAVPRYKGQEKNLIDDIEDAVNGRIYHIKFNNKWFVERPARMVAPQESLFRCGDCGEGNDCSFGPGRKRVCVVNENNDEVTGGEM